MRQRSLLDELTLVVWGFAAVPSDYAPQRYVQQPKNLPPHECAIAAIVDKEAPFAS
ncbi:MAG: hypothetical protein LAN64_15680 [Acidobacteriia bacterium]|nr:hypothetical protein [Terriglobia bacterium]